MKKMTAAIMLLLLLVSIFRVTGYASEVETVYFSDGSYITITMQTVEPKIAGQKTASKTYEYTDAKGQVAWEATLKGAFTFTGSSGNCTSATCKVTIYDDAWYEVSKTTGTENGTASAELVMGWKTLGITSRKVPISMSITCDKDGNLS